MSSDWHIQIRLCYWPGSILPVWKINNGFKGFIWTGIYRDNGLLVFKSNISTSEINILRDGFQSVVNKITVNQYLKLTCEPRWAL